MCWTGPPCRSYVEYDGDADKIHAIGQVFPVVFFLVAALVSLTTMTRMVEEKRTEIGTMKALGYGTLSHRGEIYRLRPFSHLYRERSGLSHRRKGHSVGDHHHL